MMDERKISSAEPVDVAIPVRAAATFEPWSFRSRVVIATLYGSMYFIVGTAGGRNVVSYENGVPGYVHAINSASALACLATVTAALGIPVKRPTHPKIMWSLVTLGGLSALNFYTGGRYGAVLLGFPKTMLEPIAAYCFTMRAYICGRSVLNFADILAGCAKNVKVRGYKEVMRLSAAFTIGTAITLFNTDPLVSAIVDIGHHVLGLNMSSESPGVYVLMSVLAAAGLPFAALWANYGIQKLTNGFERRGKLEPATIVTAIALPLCILCFLFPALGSANSPEGEAFSSWVGFDAAFALKMIFTLLFAAFSPLIGVNDVLEAGRTKIQGCFCFKPGEDRRGLAQEELPQFDAGSLTDPSAR